MRLIDADELKSDYGMANNCKECKQDWRDCEYDRVYSKKDFCGWVDDVPTVDAVRVVHGKWMRTGQSFLNPNKFRNYMCSNCGWESDDNKRTFNFCPNCGAKMSTQSNAPNVLDMLGE